MTVPKVMTPYVSCKVLEVEVPLHERIARVTDALTQQVIQEASELFLEDVLNLTGLEKIVQHVAKVKYAHVAIIIHPNANYGTCARISYGESITDPRYECLWVPIDSRFKTS